MTLKYCLITKERERSMALEDILKKDCQEVHFAPLFEIEYFEPYDIMFDYGAIIITSSNSIKSLIDLNIDKDIEIFSVGKITSFDLRRAGFNNIKTSLGQDAQSLKELISESYNKEEAILYICAQEVTMDFKKELAFFDIQVEKYVSYKINPKTNLDGNLRKIKFDHILIFSRRSAKIFLELTQLDLKLKDKFKLAKILCLSNKIADEFKNSDFKNIGNFQESEILKEYYSL